MNSTGATCMSIEQGQQPERETLSPQQMAKRMGVSVTQVYSLLRLEPGDENLIPHYRFGNRFVVFKDDFERWFASRKRG